MPYQTPVLQSFRAVLMAFAIGSLADRLCATEITAHNDIELRQAMARAEPGTTIKIAPGQYGHGYQLRGIERVTLEGLDPSMPPQFQGGNAALICSQCNQLTLRNLHLSGQSGNGLNIDDGGDREHPVQQVLVENVQVYDVGPKGNHDAIKCSGIDQLTIRGCTVSGWGGEGIDLVGCHHVLITDCQIRGKTGFSAVTGIQTKGGSSQVVIEKCRFENAGMRPLNIGGSTGLSYFRPIDAKYEAREITVRDNVIEGGQCAVAFASVAGAEFSRNTIRFPTKWVFRILQENVEPGFASCGDVVVRDNQIAIRRADVSVKINIGPGTRPESFQYVDNVWQEED